MSSNGIVEIRSPRQGDPCRIKLAQTVTLHPKLICHLELAIYVWEIFNEKPKAIYYWFVSNAILELLVVD